MAGSLEFIKSASGSGVSSLSVTDCFSDKYDVYYISIVTFEPTSNATGQIRLLDSGGTVISDLEYDHAQLQVKTYASFSEERNTGVSYLGSTYFSDGGDDKGVGLSLYIFNPYDSSSYTFTKGQSSVMVDGFGITAFKAIGVHKSAEQISGFQIYTAGTSFNATVNVYGVK